MTEVSFARPDLSFFNATQRCRARAIPSTTACVDAFALPRITPGNVVAIDSYRAHARAADAATLRSTLVFRSRTSPIPTSTRTAVLPAAGVNVCV